MEMGVEDQMEEFEMIRDERYKMTRTALQEIMEIVVTLSKFYAVLGEIEKIGHTKKEQRVESSATKVAGTETEHFSNGYGRNGDYGGNGKDYFIGRSGTVHSERNQVI
jgi:hypothetical protein